MDLTGTVRADNLINRNLPSLSRRIREELFSKKAVRINGRPIAKGFKVSAGDRLEVELPGTLSLFPVPDQVPRPSVIFEDQTLLILEKPGLVATHPLSPFETGTLVNALVFHWPRLIGIGTKSLEPGLVHRLDKGTSGLLVVALEQVSWLQLKKDLGAKRWRKTYRALVEGTISKSMTISLPLAHDPTDDRKMKGILKPADTRRGRIFKAITQVRPIKGFKQHTLVETQLITGVTHQIRAHLSFQGHPVVGDTLYGSKSGQTFGLPLNRFFLHAYQLSLPHPMTREQITCSSNFPKDLQRVLSRLKY
jgi:23S rRNA pseudouridine1911/1915/1917 synthase